MRITYIIGNGFDLALGLNTSYEAFRLHYVESLKGKNNAALSWFRDKIQSDKELWSDAEKAFGDLEYKGLNEKTDAQRVFENCLSDFKQQFIPFLKAANREFDKLSDEVKMLGSEFCEGVLGVGKYLRPKYKDEFYRSFEARPVLVNFINLNYTDTLEKLIEFAVDENRVFKTSVGGRPITATLNKQCVYVHGSLKEDRIVFGVDNTSQIRDPKIMEHCVTNKRLVKGYLDMGYGVETDAMNLIDDSDWIVTMGVSFGDTDKKLWDRIFGVVFEKGRGKLLILPYYKETALPPLVDGNDLIFRETRKAFASLLSDKSRSDLVSSLIDQRTMDCVRVCKPGVVDGRNGDSAYCDYLHLSIIAKRVGLIKSKAELIEEEVSRIASFIDSSASTGRAAFDYKKNNGSFEFRIMGRVFDSRWSPAAHDAVHAYKDGVKQIGFSQGLNVLPADDVDVHSLNWGRRSVIVHAEDVIFLLNNDGWILGLKIKEVDDGGSEMADGRIVVDYKLYER